MRLTIILLAGFIASSSLAFAEDREDCANKDPNMAIAACSRLIEGGKLSRSNLAVAYFNRGMAYKKKGDHDGAIADFNRAIELDPKFAFAYDSRGAVYGEKGDHDHAMADYNRAIELDPKDAPAYTDRGVAYENKGDHGHAIADHNRAIEIDPKYAIAYGNRGMVYNIQGDYDRAIADFNRAIELDPDDAYFYDYRGQWYDTKGDYDRAMDDFNKAIDLDPKRAVAYQRRAHALYSNGDHDRAIADLNSAIELDPKIGSAFDERGLVYSIQGDYDRAIADFNRAIELDPKDAAAYSNRGETYIDKAQYDRAIADLDRAIQLDPKLAAAFRIRGRAHSAKGEYDPAFTDFNEALRLQPAYAAALAERGETYEKIGDIARAKSDFLAALERPAPGPFSRQEQDKAREHLAALESSQESAASESSGQAANAPGSAVKLSGSGQTATQKFRLQSGLSIFTLRNAGEANFIVDLLDDDGNTVAGLSNAIGNYSGSVAVKIADAGGYLLNVQSDGRWSVDITQLQVSSAPSTSSFSGVGDLATSLFYLSPGLHIFRLTNRGGGNFIVDLLDSEGNDIDNLENVIGNFSGSKAEHLEAGVYLLNVKSSDASSNGTWSITIDSSSATTAPPVPAPAGDLTSAEEFLKRKIIEIVGIYPTIVTGRNKHNSASPRIAVDIEAKGADCHWVTQAADTLQRLGKVIATDDTARSLPHLQYFLFPNGREHSSVRIVRISNLVEAVKANEVPAKLFAHGRIIAGDEAVDGCLPAMLAGPEGEDWQTTYGSPDPRPEVMRKMLPLFEAIKHRSKD